MEGQKFDAGKLRWTLLPFKAVKEVVKVLELGAKKYSVDNWKKISKERYKDALMRHVTSYLMGEKNDKESGLNHLAHAICCCLFIIWFDLKQEEQDV